jgi:hypothetical protein
MSVGAPFLLLYGRNRPFPFEEKTVGGIKVAPAIADRTIIIPAIWIASRYSESQYQDNVPAMTG